MGYLQRVLGVTLRDKELMCEIHKTRDIKPLLRIETSELCWIGYVSRMSPKEWRTKSFGLQSTSMGKQPEVCPRTKWRNYISDLSWSRLGVEPAEPFEIVVDREVISGPLGAAVPATSQRKSGHKNEWINEYVDILNRSIYEIVFSSFAKSECHIQIIKYIWMENRVFVNIIWKYQT